MIIVSCWSSIYVSYRAAYMLGTVAEQAHSSPGRSKHGAHDAVCRLPLQALVQGLVVAQEHLFGTVHGALLPLGLGQEVM